MIDIPDKYQNIWAKAVPYLRQGRQGELEHCQKTAEEVYRLGKDKGWNLDILIPVAMFHDIGHSAVLPEHFHLISGPKKEENSKLVHMLTGAKIAHDVLKEVNYPDEKIRTIVEIIAIHDKKDKSLFNTEEKRIFHDIDRLDRFTDATFETTRKEFGLNVQETFDILEKDLIPDIISDDFRKIALENLQELKIKYQEEK